MKMWGGGFGEQLDPQAWRLNASIDFDRRLALQDVRGSQAWAQALAGAGILDEVELSLIDAGLRSIAEEFEQRSFLFQESDEDIHTAVERRLGELIGPVAGKLHSGRSRNDQVATDLRLWLLDHLPRLDLELHNLQSTLVMRAGKDEGILMPGYTHIRRAQPILLSHWWLAHFWPLQRDRQRLAGLRERTASLPLGAGALAGAPFPVDREALALALGFDSPAPNSLDAVSDRDFVAEFLFCAALSGLHLSRLAEALILFSSAEFGFFELSDAFATGSSLMPQKKNPDVFELARGKAGSLVGNLAGLMAVLKGLPSAYDKDLQEDKLPVFSAYDTLVSLLPVMSNAIRSLSVDVDRLDAGLEAGLMATDLADLLVSRGLPFREAHTLVGKAVQLAAEKGKSLDALNLAELGSLSPAFTGHLTEAELQAVFDPRHSIARRNVIGGTAPEAVAAQLKQAQDLLALPNLD